MSKLKDSQEKKKCKGEKKAVKVKSEKIDKQSKMKIKLKQKEKTIDPINSFSRTKDIRNESIFWNAKKYLIWFIIWLSFIAWISYASTGTIGWLFEKISWQWKLVWTNIKDGTVWTTQLWTNSVTTTKIVDKNVTEAKLADTLVNKINNPTYTETDPTAVKLTWNQSIWWAKTFTSPVVWVVPTANNHFATKKYVDDAIATALITYSWNTWTWWSCSVSCGWWTQIRNVTCLRNDWTTVADSYCTTTKPVTSQTCNTWACSYIVSWSFWVNADWATISVCWTNILDVSNWNFTTTKSYGSVCNNITATKPWYICTTTTNWPASLTSNVTNIAWNCTLSCPWSQCLDNGYYIAASNWPSWYNSCAVNVSGFDKTKCILRIVWAPGWDIYVSPSNSESEATHWNEKPAWCNSLTSTCSNLIWTTNWSAATFCTYLKNTVPPPVWTNWYLPTLGSWWLQTIKDNKSKVNIVNSSRYWSSSYGHPWDSQSTPWWKTLRFNDVPDSGAYWYSDYKVRCIAKIEYSLTDWSSTTSWNNIIYTRSCKWNDWNTYDCSNCWSAICEKTLALKTSNSLCFEPTIDSSWNAYCKNIAILWNPEIWNWPCRTPTCSWWYWTASTCPSWYSVYSTTNQCNNPNDYTPISLWGSLSTNYPAIFKTIKWRWCPTSYKLWYNVRICKKD